MATAQEMGTRFTNNNARQIYISADWAAEDLASNP